MTVFTTQLIAFCIHRLRNIRISGFPEVEEFLVMLYGFVLPAFLLDVLIIPTPGGSFCVAAPQSGDRHAEG